MYSRKLLKSAQITIPKKIQTELGFKEGDYLFIYEYQNSIVIVKKHNNDTLNQCVFRNGKISIPAELRRLLNITAGMLLTLDINQNKLMITVGNQGFLKEA